MEIFSFLFKTKKKRCIAGIFERYGFAYLRDVFASLALSLSFFPFFSVYYLVRGLEG